MYTKEFVEWVGDNGYFFLPGKGWYVWPDYEKDEIFICNTLNELFEIYKEYEKI